MIRASLLGILEGSHADLMTSEMPGARVVRMRTMLGAIIILLPAALLATALNVDAAMPDPPDALRSAVDAARRGNCAAVLDGLRRLSEESTPTGARAAYLWAHCLSQQGRHSEAREAFTMASQRHSTLAHYARVRAAMSALRAGTPSRAAELARLPAGGSAAVRRKALLVRAEALLAAGDAKEAALVAREVLRGEHPDEPTARGWWLLGRAAETSGDVETAQRAYAMAWWAIPGNPYAADARLRLGRLSAGRVTLSAVARAERGRRLFDKNERQAAEQELALAVKGLLPRDLAATAWYHLGLLRLGTPAAATAFEQAARYPADRDRALFWWGQALLGAGRGSEGRTVWRRLLGEYPASLWSARAVAALGRIAEAARRWKEADRWYELLAGQFPESPRADEGRWRRAWLRYRTGRSQEALALFQRYAEAYPDTPRAPAHLYWASRVGRRLGVDADALLRSVAQRYPLTFYGQRAWARLHGPELPPPPTSARDVLPADRFALAYEELAALGLDQDAAEEVNALVAGDPRSPHLRAAAILQARVGNVFASVETAESLLAPALYGGAVADVELWRLAYPRPFWDQIATTARRNRLDPLLVLAVIREESRFDPQAVSSARAVGLMQLLPSTARGVLGAPVGPSELMDPAVNIRAGVLYLAGLLRRFQGNVPLAVGAYNAGPGGVGRYVDLARADIDQFVEGLPFAETRAYVQRVLQSYGIYRWLYE